MKILVAILCLICVSCKKGWLDAKPDQSFIIVKQVGEAQALLDHTLEMNQNEPSSLDEGGCEYYFLTESRFNTRSPFQKNFYTWASAKDFYAGSVASDWEGCYKRIFITNTVLQMIENINANENPVAWNNVKGSALFFRSFNYFKLAQLFCKPYDAATAQVDKGLILKLSPEVNEIAKRSTIQQSYDLIINDLQLALPLLPVRPLQLFKTRPSKIAAYALLSRIYLSMGKYAESERYADSVLSNPVELINLNTLDENAVFPFQRFNEEVIFHALALNNSLLATIGNTSNLDMSFYNSFNDNDLRKKLWFTDVPSHLYKGSLTCDRFSFKGIGTAEIYLNKAECLARRSQVTEAMNTLNHLLEKRWRVNVSTPLTATNETQAMNIILEERKKELCFQGIRWIDLRRLNLEGKYTTTLNRKVGTQNFTLPPNDPRYTYPIPPSEIIFNDVEQNPR